uniref:Uncharacterized protein n=1 Tax=Arundo donax TaxID=35708 RepID=A0A0A9E396_ARUDO
MMPHEDVEQEQQEWQYLRLPAVEASSGNDSTLEMMRMKTTSGSSEAGDAGTDEDSERQGKARGRAVARAATGRSGACCGRVEWNVLGGSGHGGGLHRRMARCASPFAGPSPRRRHRHQSPPADGSWDQAPGCSRERRTGLERRAPSTMAPPPWIRPPPWWIRLTLRRCAAPWTSVAEDEIKRTSSRGDLAGEMG